MSDARNNRYKQPGMLANLAQSQFFAITPHIISGEYQNGLFHAEVDVEFGHVDSNTRFQLSQKMFSSDYMKRYLFYTQTVRQEQVMKKLGILTEHSPIRQVLQQCLVVDLL